MLEPMLHHAQRDRRQVEHLPGLDRHHRGVGQRVPAPGAGIRGVRHHLIRGRDPTQRRPLVPGLPTRAAVGALPPRPRRRLVIPLAARRPVRVARILAHPPFQLRDRLEQGHQLPAQLGVLPAQHGLVSAHRGELIAQQHDRAVPLGQLGAPLTELGAQRALTRVLSHAKTARGEVAVTGTGDGTDHRPLWRSPPQDQAATPISA